MSWLLDMLYNLLITCVNQHMLFQKTDHTIDDRPHEHQYVIQVHLMWKMIVTHMYLPSMWYKAKPNALHSQITNLDSFEEWYRSELRGRMVQTLMQVSVQSLNVILQDIDMHDDKAVQDAMVLFRPLDGNVSAEVEYHNTRYKKDLCKRYQDNVTASGPKDIARVM